MLLNAILITIIIILVILFLLLWNNPRTVVVEKDAESQEKAKYEEIYRKKQAEMQLILTEERKKSIEKIRAEEKQLLEEIKKREKEIELEIQDKKTKALLDMEESLQSHERIKKIRQRELNDMIERAEELTEEKIEQFRTSLTEFMRRQHAAVDSAKREDELRQKDNFYKIVLSEEELEELSELNKAIKKLRNPLPFRKAVYDIYYKPKINEMVLRVVGNVRRTGIYKITHSKSKKVYIGQSVDIGNRWKQHAKRGCGADQLTQNKLYPEMLREGIESFTWEIIEEVEVEKLTEAEKYWQEYYDAKGFGYSIK